MRPLIYSINITLDGCCDHEAGDGGEEMHEQAAATLDRVDALLFGRVVYEMMESAFRLGSGGADGTDPFVRKINETKKYVVSSTLKDVDWNAELINGNLEQAVRRLKNEPGKGILTGGVTLPLALADMGLIDEYQFVVLPRIAGRGPTLLSGVCGLVKLKLVAREELKSGAVALRYVPEG